ncbi:MAG: TetR/AcrR family transcriptional regulator [Bacteriovoracia bacterium]
MSTETEFHDVKPDRSRAALVRSANVLFARNGYHSTTVRELAEHARVNISAISYHFGGKEELYRECIRECAEDRLRAAKAYLVAPASAEEMRVRLKLWVSSVLRANAENPEVALVTFREFESDVPVTPDLFEKLVLPIVETMDAFMAGAQSRGFLRADLDSGNLAYLFWSLVLNVARFDQRRSQFVGQSIAHEPYRDQITDEILKIFLDGATRSS